MKSIHITLVLLFFCNTLLSENVVHISGTVDQFIGNKIYFIQDRTGFFHSDGDIFDSTLIDSKGNFNIDLKFDTPKMIELQFEHRRYMFHTLYMIPNDSISINFTWQDALQSYKMEISNENLSNLTVQKFSDKEKECIWGCKEKKADSLSKDMFRQFIENRRLELNKIVQDKRLTKVEFKPLISELLSRISNDSLISELYLFESHLKNKDSSYSFKEFYNLVNDIKLNKNLENSNNYLILISKVLDDAYEIYTISEKIEQSEDLMNKYNKYLDFAKNYLNGISYDIAIVTLLENISYSKLDGEFNDYINKILEEFNKTYTDKKMYDYILNFLDKFKYLRKGNRFPNICINDMKNQRICTDDLLGKIILIEFWATWCQYCEQNIEAVNKLKDKFSNGNITFLNVALEITNTDKLKEIVKNDSIGINLYQLGGFQSELCKSTNLPIYGIPIFFILDKQRKIYSIHHSADDPEIENNIKLLLNE